MTDAELLQHYIQCKRIIHGAERSRAHWKAQKRTGDALPKRVSGDDRNRQRPGDRGQRIRPDAEATSASTQKSMRNSSLLRAA